MLTIDQKENLLVIVSNFRFIQLLTDAIQIWERQDIQPSQKRYGIEFKNYKFEKFSSRIGVQIEPSPCCLIGSALLGKDLNDDPKTYDINEAMFFALKKIYDINHDEANALIDGFDGVKTSGFKLLYPDAYNFGKSVAIALGIWREEL